MKAVTINSYGNHKTLQLQDVPIPKIKPTDVLVKVYATSVNPVDWKLREGFLKDIVPITFPFILGFDFSGEVCEIGSEVTEYKIGDLVYGRPSIYRNGAYAEYLAVDASEIAPRPKNLNHIQAASIPLAGITAWEALVTTAKIGLNTKVVILGASGGVGTIATQLTHHKRAIAIGICSSSNVKMVRSLGATATEAYDKSDFSETIKEADVVFDAVGGNPAIQSLKTLRSDNAIFVSIVEPLPEEVVATYPGLASHFIFIEPSSKILRSLSKLIESHEIKPVIETVFQLSEIEDAHLHSISGRARGKIVIQVA